MMSSRPTHTQAARTRLSGSWIGSLCVVLAALIGACTAEPPDSRPNVVIVTLDTTRVDAIGCYGGPTGVSPTIDAFAREGVLFRNAYSSVPLTLPAHSSLFTGRYPDEHGVRTNSSYVLPEEEITLAEILNEEGYETGAFVAAYVLDRQFGLAQGFEHYDDQLEAVDLAEKTVAELSADVITDRALAWLAERDEDRPFLAWIHYYDPHYPHELPAGEASKFASTYHDEVAFVDAQLARVRRWLEQSGELSNTLVVLTADHGEGQGEHGEHTHGYFIYQGTQHIPLILSHPSLAVGTTSERNSSLVDLVPTVLGFLGMEPPVTSGEDLLREGTERNSAVFMEAELGRITFGLSPLRGVLEGTHKLIDTPSPELYDISLDPTESRNVASEESARVVELRALLKSRPQHQSSARVEHSAPGTDARLQALGYTAGAGDTEVTRTEWTSAQLARWSRLANDGMRDYLAGDYANTIASLRPLVEECPGVYSGQLYLGMSLVRTGELEGGMRHLERAAEMEPDRSADVWWDIATGRAMAGNIDGARQALEKTVELRPTHVRALQKLAELCLQGGEHDRARALLDALIEQTPASKEGRWASRERSKLGP